MRADNLETGLREIDDFLNKITHKHLKTLYGAETGFFPSILVGVPDLVKNPVSLRTYAQVSETGFFPRILVAVTDLVKNPVSLVGVHKPCYSS